MKTGRHSIEDGAQFNHLIPKATGGSRTITRFAKVKDTVSLMKQVIEKTADQTRLLAQRLRGTTPYESCANVWKFTFKHLQYEKDQANKEQVRSPARAWHDRKRGIDCDCLSVWIGSILYNLRIPFLIRLTRYTSQEFEHVYPVALIGNQSIIMDCVVHQFNYEVPYTAKKDIPMELQFLNGFEGWEPEEPLGDDPFEGMGVYPMEEAILRAIDEDLDGLSGKAQRQARQDARQEERSQKKAQQAQSGKPTLKERLTKGVHVINRVNPGAALVRAGILVGMKTNMFNISRRLRYAYLSDDRLRQIKNLDMTKIPHLREVRGKLEKIFFGAGGKPENLKAAILTGRGNRDKAVPLQGLGYVHLPSVYEDNITQILGPDVYTSEFDEIEIPGTINGLGEAVSAAATVAAASSILAALAAMVKKIGSIFKPGTPEAAKEAIEDNTAAQEDKQLPADVKAALNSDSSNLPAPADGSTDISEMNLDEFEVQDRSAAAPDEKKDDDSGGIGQWIKNHPIATGAIALTAIGLGILAVKMYKSKKSTSKTPARSLSGIEGVEGLDGLDGVRRKTSTTTKSAPKKQTSQKRKGSTSRRRTIRKVRLI